MRGVLGSVSHYCGRLYRTVRPVKLKPHPFDLRHGVYTTALIEGSALASGHAHDLYNVCYLPSHPSMVTGAIDLWRGVLREADAKLNTYTLFDLGAGMGRALMVASLFPFQTIVGVELSKLLCEQAERNLEMWLRTEHACDAIEIANCDATEYAWPRSPILIYMFNPFEEPVVAALLQSLERAREEGARPIDILYVHPIAAACLDTHPRVRLLTSDFCYLSEEDRAADPYNDPKSPFYGVTCNVYRLE
jgi:hypothetical protein